MLSQSIQDYLKTIYKLEEHGSSTTMAISKMLNVSGASVTGMLKRLSEMKLVKYGKYKGVTLTEDGKKIALEILRHHRLIELYLKESLGFSLAKVHDEACRLEHYVSEEFVEKIDDMLGHPEFSPMGNPIPSKEGILPESHEIPLHDLELNTKAVIKRIGDEDPKMISYFEEIGLLPHQNIEVKDKAPFNGPITIKLNGFDKIIGMEIAESIFVEITDKKKAKNKATNKATN